MEWEEEEKGMQFNSIHPRVNRQDIVKLKGKDDIKLTRLRMGHCGLRSGLRLVGKHRDERRTQCAVMESVKRVMLHCRLYREQRKILFGATAKLGVETYSLKTLSGDSKKKSYY